MQVVNTARHVFVVESMRTSAGVGSCTKVASEGTFVSVTCSPIGLVSFFSFLGIDTAIGLMPFALK